MNGIEYKAIAFRKLGKELLDFREGLVGKVVQIKERDSGKRRTGMDYQAVVVCDENCPPCKIPILVEKAGGSTHRAVANIECVFRIVPRAEWDTFFSRQIQLGTFKAIRRSLAKMREIHHGW